MREQRGRGEGEHQQQDVNGGEQHGMGGISVKNLKVFNEVLLGKLKWNLFHQRRSLWGDVLASKYKG